MDAASLLFSAPLIAVYALVVCYLVYAWSKTVAPAFIPSPNKIMPYVGGEAMHGQVCHPGYRFFYVALFFTVVHVAALIIAIAPADAPLAGTLGYLGIIAVAIAILRWEQ
jgi:NADH:ubiquinone oxidoreductase subunit 3 (subunit A)